MAAVTTIALSMAGRGRTGRGRPPSHHDDTAAMWGAPRQYSVSIGAEGQPIKLSALEITDRAAWLATSPRVVLSGKGASQVELPIVADDDPTMVRLLGSFDGGEGQRLAETHEGSGEAS